MVWFVLSASALGNIVHMAVDISEAGEAETYIYIFVCICINIHIQTQSQ